MTAAVRIKRLLWSARLASQGPVLANLRLLRETERLPAARVAQLQEELLTDLLLHAHRSTPYYARILQETGVVSADGRTDLSKFGDLPLLDKQTLRKEFEELKSSDLAGRNWYVNSSGGSTGETARFIQDDAYDAWVGAVKLQFDEWSGCAMCEPKAVLWGSARDIDGGSSPLRTRVGRWLCNETWFRTSRLTEEDILAQVRAINRLRPRQLLAYAQSAYELARIVEKTGTAVNPPGSIMTTAGTLYPEMRATIERVLGAPVFNRYGCREVGDIACDCERHLGLHVNTACHYLEVLRPDGTPAAAEEDGELVVTSLRNYAMPLVRYRIGDVGAWASEPCSCGRGFPLLARVTGRTYDFCINSRGERIGAEYFFFELEKQEWIRRFRIVQDEVDKVTLWLQLYADSPRAPEAGLEAVREIVRVAMGYDCRVSIEIVEELDASSSGKHLCLVSSVGSHEAGRM